MKEGKKDERREGRKGERREERKKALMISKKMFFKYAFRDRLEGIVLT